MKSKTTLAKSAPGTKVVELYGKPTDVLEISWAQITASQQCPYLGKKCWKVRKSIPDQSIGTCTVAHKDEPMVICPSRFRERQKVIFDCIHLLTMHEAGNDLYAIPEVDVPGGKIDFILTSARHGKVKDFVGIELQSLDTTGSFWPERQKFLKTVGVGVSAADLIGKPAGMNWKMSAKTILMQMHHKVETFEHLGKKIALVVQDSFLSYMEEQFSFGHLSSPAVLGDSAHFHAYGLIRKGKENVLDLVGRKSTDMAGIASALELRVSARVELDQIISTLESKLKDALLLSVAT